MDLRTRSEEAHVTDLERARELVGTAAAWLARSRQRLDDLNVYPVPDGDTGTNLLLTANAAVEALESSASTDRAGIARELTRAALMGARGNSGVILSQIVRGAAELLAEGDAIESATVATALRAASDAAYRAIREPVEGTMLTVIRELAEAAETEAVAEPALPELFRRLVRRAEESVARTPEQLAILREAGVVDAGGAGLLELLRGVAAAVAGEPMPDPATLDEAPSPQAIHQELSRFRYCTSFVVEGSGLDATRVRGELEPIGDSVLVVGDASAMKVHVHTDEPGIALQTGTRAGVICGVEVADMHRQTLERERRLADLAGAPAATNVCDVVAVVAGEGNRALFESLGVARVVHGGQTMNPAAAEVLAAIEETTAPDVIVLPNNANVVLAAEQAAALSERTVYVVPTRTLQAGLAAMVAYNAELPGDENVAEMETAAAAAATGAVTTASREVALAGRRIPVGAYLGLVDGVPVAGGDSFESVARDVVERLVSVPRDVLTLLAGADAPPLEAFADAVRERHPGLEVALHDGGQPHYSVLLSAE